MGASVPFDYFVGFCRALREEGLEISPARASTYLHALKAVDLASMDEVFWSGRATLIATIDEAETYDAVFNTYFRFNRHRALAFAEDDGTDDAARADSSSAQTLSREDERNALEIAEARSLSGKASSRERIKGVSLPDATDAERAFINEIKRLALRTAPEVVSRRYKRSLKGGRIHIRKSLKDVLRTDGELIRLRRRRKKRRFRKAVVLIDISGSMALQARANLLFAYALTHSLKSVECYCLGTRLTRISDALQLDDVAAMLRAVGAVAIDWEGGTRLGDGLQAFLSAEGRAFALTGADVFFLSDGLERGDPEALAAGVARLVETAKRVHWISPLAGSARFSPKTRALSRIAPLVRKFYPGADLAQLTGALAEIWGRSHAAAPKSRAVCTANKR
ncbi:MAG: VWA domain-containing protein [Pseudomonadota bacterium]